MNIKPLLFVLALLPATAIAGERCKFERPVSLDLDLSGARAVVFEVNSHDLRLHATPGARATLSGRACASSNQILEQLSVSQEKAGDKLVVKLERRQQGLDIHLGNTYARLDVSGSLPDDILVQLKVGSGDASLTGARAMSADVGSGDVTASAIKGLATAAVGSGDITLRDIGALHVLSIGSGDVEATGVRGDARVDSIGSGDLDLREVQGDVRIGSIGSGDAEVGAVRGAVTLDTLGSGSLEVRGAGSLRVDRIGSGDVDHTGVTGAVELPRRR